MTISSVQHAERMIRKAVSHGPVGDEYRPVANRLCPGRAPSCQEREHLFTALDNLEKRHEVYLVRHPFSGLPIRADKYDCSKAAVVVKIPKLAISAVELLIQLHALLKRDAGEEGSINNGKSAPEYIRALYDELAQTYDVDYGRVYDVFMAMSTLDLRGNARSLVGVGMEVSCVDLQIGGENASAELADARAEMARLTEENAGLLAENAQLTEANDRLEQSVGDLRERNEHLAATKAEMLKIKQRIDHVLGE